MSVATETKQMLSAFISSFGSSTSISTLPPKSIAQHWVKRPFALSLDEKQNSGMLLCNT